jgi:UDP-N-acetylglucosamine acyltransferase
MVGNDVTLANNAVLGGHVEVGNNVFFGGQAAVHQFVRVGEGSMISGLAGVRADVVPFGFVLGSPGYIVGLNIVGLRRRGVTRADMHRLRRAFRLLFDGQNRFGGCRNLANDHARRAGGRWRGATRHYLWWR